MATYVVLFNWTEQGIKSYADSPKRVDAAGKVWGDLGVKVKDIYWTIGPHDLVGIMEAPDDEALAAAMLRLGAVGTVRTTTMRAFARKETEAVIAKEARRASLRRGQVRATRSLRREPWHRPTSARPRPQAPRA